MLVGPVLEAMDSDTEAGMTAGTGFAAVAVGIGAAEVAGEMAVGIEAAEAADAADEFADRADYTAWGELGRTVFASVVTPNTCLERSLLFEH